MKAAGAWIFDPCRPHTGGNLSALRFPWAGSSPLARLGVSLVCRNDRATCERAMAAGAHPMMGTALHAFEATEATHIALSCGQRVRIIEERDDGWSYGEADQTGERGIFPTSYVQPDGQDGAQAETSSLAPKLPRSDSFTTIASRRATLPNIAAAQSVGQRLRGDLAKALSSTNADEVPDVSPWDSVSCFGDAQEEPELRSLGDSGGSGLGLTSDEVANLLGSIELNNVEQLQHWARTEPITGGDLEQLLFLERAEADAILLNAGLSSALHRGRLLSQVQGWSQCGVPPRLIKSSSPGPVHAMPLAAPTQPTANAIAAAAAVSADADAVSTEATLTAPGEWSIDAVTVSTFSQMFANACASQGPGTDRLGKAEAGPVLTMSGLPTETLLQIWSLADVDGDDRLDLRGYLLCCWLVQRSVQRRLPPPASLPPELLASATAAVAPSTVSTSTKAQPTELTKPMPMPPATPVGEEEFGFDSGGFGDAGVVGPVAAVAVAATAEKAAVEVQARLQTDQLAERLVAASLDQPRPTTASPGASLSRQVASGTTSTPERVSTHVTQQLLLTVLSESARSLPDKPMRSAACRVAEPCTFMTVHLPCPLVIMPTCIP